MQYLKMPRIIALAVGLTLGTGPALAEPPPPPVRTLLVDPALLARWLGDHDPVADAVRARVDAALATSAQTHVLPNPQLGVELGNFALGHGNVDPNSGVRGPTGIDRTTHVSLGISELVELGKRGPRQAAAALRVQSTEQAAVGILGARLGDALATLGKLAYVSARRDVVARNLDAARELLALEKNRLDNKDLSASEFARIELDTQQLAIQLARADSEVAVATASCSATLFAPCERGELDPTALDHAAPLPTTLPAAETQVRERPIHQADRLEIAALGEDATLADHRRIPDPTIGIGYSRDNYNYGGNLPQVLAVTIGIPLPLFDRGGHDAAAARATARATEAQERALVREGVGRASSLQAQLVVLARTLAELEGDAVPKSTQIIAQTRRAFDLGQARLADLLLVERAHRDLLLEVLDTRFELFSIRAQLRQELGLDDEAARAIAQRKS